MLHRSRSLTFQAQEQLKNPPSAGTGAVSSKEQERYRKQRSRTLTISAELAGKVTFSPSLKSAPSSAEGFSKAQSPFVPALPLLPIAQRNSAARQKMGPTSSEKARQAQTSHMLKTGRRGNPFCKVCIFDHNLRWL